MPAASSVATPSARARRTSSPASSPGRHVASTALPRFISNFVYFHRMMSARGTDSKPEPESAAATVVAVSSMPDG